MTAEKETSEFQVKELEVQLAEQQEGQGALSEKIAALEQEAAKSNTYLQELEGLIENFT